jgi:hypothetical protein
MYLAILEYRLITIRIILKSGPPAGFLHGGKPVIKSIEISPQGLLGYGKLPSRLYGKCLLALTLW